MGTLSIDNKLEMFWKGFANSTAVFLWNFGPSDQPLQIPLKVFPSGLDQLLGSSISWSS